MITGFISDTLPRVLDRLAQLVRESLLYRLLCALWQLFTESLLFRAARAVYRWVRRLCCRSAIGRTLSRHPQEGKIYEGSLLAALFDWVLGGITKLLRFLFRALTFGSNDSAVISLARRGLNRMPWLDFETLTGGAALLLLICPSQLWRNIFALALGALLLIALLILAAAENRPALRFRTVGLPLALFAFATVVGVGTASDRHEAIRVFCFFLAAFMFFASIAGSVTSEKKLEKVLAFLYAAVLIAAAVAIIQRLIGVKVNFSLTDMNANRGMPGRVYSVYENPNNYGEIIVLLLPVSAAWAFSLKKQWQRICACAGLLLPVLALLMTYARACWVGFALAAVVFLFLWNKKALPVFFLLALLAVPLVPQTIWNRILTIGSTSDSSNMYRIYIWNSVLDMLHDYGLIGLGLGPGNFHPVYELYCPWMAKPAQHAHMVYLEVWIEMGLLGIAGYLAYYFSTVRNALVHLKQASRQVRLVLIAGVSSLAGIAFVSAAEYVWYYPRVLFCFFILTGVMAAAVELSRQNPEVCAAGGLS